MLKACLLSSIYSTAAKHLKPQADGMMKNKKHPFSACVTKMKGKIDSPEAFCAKLKDIHKGTTKWRGQDKNKADDTSGNRILAEHDVQDSLDTGAELNVFDSAVFYIENKILSTRNALDYAKEYVRFAGDKYPEVRKENDLRELHEYIEHKKSLLNKSMQEFLSRIAEIKEV